MASHPEPSLNDGLTALKQGDYLSAKAILSDVAANGGERDRLQAQIGLVVVYSRTGEVTKGLALCETLIHSSNPQVKQWAQTSLPQLQKRHQNNPTPNVTGFVPFKGEDLEDKEDLQAETNLSSPHSPLRVSPPETLREHHSSSPPETLREQRGEPAHGGGFTIPPSPPPPPSSRSPKPLSIHWRQAGRAKIWQPLPKRGLILLRLLAVGTFIALFYVVRELVDLVMDWINNALVALPFLAPIQFLYRDPSFLLLLGLLILTIISPWLLDWLLERVYKVRSLSKETLNTYSKEAVRVIQRYCQPRGRPLPKLGVIPIAVPIALTYGHLPRTATILVSQGLLEQLAADEIATIYALQLGQIFTLNCAVMSLLLLVTIPVYQLYLQLSQRAEKISHRFCNSVLSLIGSFVYLIWCLLTGTGLWLSHRRLLHSDRVGAEVTGNPNGLIRALLKIAIGIAGNIDKEQQTPWQLESLNLMLPMGYKQGLWLGSVAPHTTFESLLMWEYLNPYRHALAINDSHPITGDRLQSLCQIARYWHVEPELYLDTQQPIKLKLQTFLLQIAPFLGIPFGLAFATLIWLGWQILFALKILNLKWIYDDWSFVVGCILIGFSVGILIRINYFFPNITSSATQSDRLISLLTNPTALPIDSIPVCFAGKLLGRQGASNYLGQDLILQSSTGWVRLHHVPWWGQSVKPQQLIGRQVTVIGWLRRGATPWLDIQTLQTQGGKTLSSPHPILSIFVAVLAEVWGALIMLRG